VNWTSWVDSQICSYDPKRALTPKSIFFLIHLTVEPELDLNLFGTKSDLNFWDLKKIPF
jgi:hypothetical protein